MGGHESRNRVKITALETAFNAELAAGYGTEGLNACPVLMEGQMYYAKSGIRKIYC